MIIEERMEKESNHDYALRMIQDNIVSLELKPGSMISEQEIACELGLSRTPVHEALQELAKTRIVEIKPQRGSLVSLIDMNLVEESCFIRATIESAVTERACRMATVSDIEKLEENVVLQEFHHGKNNLARFMEYDNAFHQMMYRIADRMLCYYTVQLMNIHHKRLRTLRLHLSNSEIVIAEHKKILDAFRRKDSQGAKEVFLEHLNRIFVDEKEIRSMYPQYFA